ncbi:MAG: hypothetical protein V4706_01865 [Pseudomonadota bacterium]
MADITERSFQGFVRKLKDMGGFFAETVVDGGGQAGCHTETGVSVVTPPGGATHFTSITILADAQFAVLTDSSEVGDGTTGITYPAGLTIFGKFTTFTLASGKVRAYV